MSWIDSSTKLFGVVGRNIGYTLSPAIHNYIFREVGYNAVYLAFDVAEEKFDYIAKALVDICEGLNITIPYKERIMQHLNTVDDSAKIVGAVNTVHRGKGYNTDYIAIEKLLKSYENIIDSGICYVFGAGGAAKAVIAALSEYGCRIKVVNRSVERAEKLVRDLGKSIDIEIASSSTCGEATAVVNAAPNPDFVSDNCFHKSLGLAIELVYRPVETSAVRRAKSVGASVINGLDILVHQAVEAQRIWLGIEFPIEKVVAHLYARKLIW